MKNVEIEKYINKEDDNFLKNSCFPAHYVNRFIQFHVLMKQNLISLSICNYEYRNGG